MDITFDSAKNVRNIALHGISFARAAEFEWIDALIVEERAEITANADIRRSVASGYGYTCSSSRRAPVGFT